MTTNRVYYDDNFGHYAIEDEEDVAFYHQVQRESVVKKCAGCGRRVRLRREYAICNECATRAEHGLEY
jgi:hypothetical protein